MTLEQEVIHRRLPQLLRLENGRIADNKEAFAQRRQELLKILCSSYAGFSPGFPVETSGKAEVREENAYGGKAVSERIILSLHTPFQAFAFPFTLLIPKKIRESCPVFVYLGFGGEPAEGLGEEIMDSGYALAHINYQELAPDRDDGFVNGMGCFCKRNPFDGWGHLGMWAYGASRVLDYLLAREELDAGRMAVMGHSRLGKTALWCGALDERFGLVVSNDSGGGGAALFRGKTGEQIADLSGKGSAHWFCGNFVKYAGREEELPFDQHFLLALMAPRYLYVSSASEDEWADPHSELLACVAASPAYELLGTKGLVQEEQEGRPWHQGHIGYHLRQGTHHLGREDWQQVIAYRDRHHI